MNRLDGLNWVNKENKFIFLYIKDENDIVLCLFLKKKSIDFKLGFDQIKDQTWLLSKSFQGNYSFYLFILEVA